MKYILILFSLSAVAAPPTAVEFNDYKSCQEARNFVSSDTIRMIDLKYIGFCFQKGEE